jgi:hypothetical protein
MRTPDERPAAPRPYRGGSKWSGRGGRRLRHESLRDNREQERGGRGKVDLGSRELNRLLEDWDGGADAPEEEEGE